MFRLQAGVRRRQLAGCIVPRRHTAAGCWPLLVRAARRGSPRAYRVTDKRAYPHSPVDARRRKRRALGSATVQQDRPAQLAPLPSVEVVVRLSLVRRGVARLACRSRAESAARVSVWLPWATTEDRMGVANGLLAPPQVSLRQVAGKLERCRRLRGAGLSPSGQCRTIWPCSTEPRRPACRFSKPSAMQSREQ